MDFRLHNNVPEDDVLQWDTFADNIATQNVYNVNKIYIVLCNDHPKPELNLRHGLVIHIETPIFTKYYIVRSILGAL